MSSRCGNQPTPGRHRPLHDDGGHRRCHPFGREHDLRLSVRGGGNFGVVSSFEFQLHEVGPM